jgi:uncharacterized protein YdeI (YjbR/CyaY-like superfamily)
MNTKQLTMNAKVDAFLGRQQRWQDELTLLRSIALSCGLDEDLKWGLPCYSHAGDNIIILQSFKETCALMFFNGALLKDPKNILEAPGKNSQYSRRVMFTNVADVSKKKSILKSYIGEAIQVAKAGLKVEKKSTADYEVPDELKNKFKELPALKTAFNALTPGRQRGYLLHFAGAKQSKTREARIDKCIQDILAGKGLND